MTLPSSANPQPNTSLAIARRLRLPAIACSLAVLACELISRPFANMGISDDGPYILIARTLSSTGHIAYNGNTTPFLGWQLYLGAAFIKIFGFSFSAVRMSTLLIAVILAFVLQRTLVRASISERNATIGTLALVLSPLYLMLSVTFMTDISGLFAVVLCLYGCLRALQAATSRTAIAWLCFAVAANAICGTSRQIAWLGVLVMVPSTLWLLRSQRRVFFAGAAATAAGALFILGCMIWFARQIYNVHESLVPASLPVAHTLAQFVHTLLDIPFLLLPIIVLFLPQMYKSGSRTAVGLSAIATGYILLAVFWKHPNLSTLLEPTQGNWVTPHGGFEGLGANGVPPVFLHLCVQVLLTLLSIGGLLGLSASFLRSHKNQPVTNSSEFASWHQLRVLVLPFSIAYTLILIPRAATNIVLDRYLLELLFIALLCLLRYYQDYIQTSLPLASVLLVAVVATYGIAVTHNLFTFYRARVALAAELHAAGVHDTSIDNGWEYNYMVELQHANFINDPRMALPAHAYAPTPPPAAGTCETTYFDNTPHIHAIYGVSFNPNACYGPAPFAPVHYSRWLASSPGTLYVVKYVRAPTQ